MAVKKYYTKRTNPNCGVIMEMQPDGSAVAVTGELPYSECMARVMASRDDVLTLFKIARIAPRKNARRKLFRRILARHLSDAVHQFRIVCEENAEDPATFQLLTGDWKIICERGPDGSVEFKNHLD